MEDIYKYSVIIPHKNTPELLQRCLDSIPKRSDIQTIVVDDNSNPDIVAFNRFPGKDRPYTEIFLDKTGKGAGRARNVGLEHARGRWIVFADADDYFHPGAFETIDSKVGDDENYDMIYFCCDSRDGETGEKIADRVPHIRKGIEGDDMDLLRYRSFVPWGKVISHRLIMEHNLRFEEIEASNDVMFSTQVGFYSRQVGVIRNDLYCCTQNKTSLYFATPSKSRIMTRVKAGARVNAFMNAHGIRGYRYDTVRYTMMMLPHHPCSFLRAAWEGRYREAPVEYLRIIAYKLLK